MGFSVGQPGQPSKLGRHVMNVSLVMGRDCGPAAKHCIDDCYAFKAWIWPSVKKSWTGSSELLRSDPDAYFAAIEGAVSRVRPLMFRIHVSGDFISADHLRRWAELCGNNPQTQFLAFTKSFDHLPNTPAGLPTNLEIVLSMWPSMVDSPEDIPDRLLGGYAIAFAGERAEYIDTRYEMAAMTSVDCPGACDTCGICWALDDQRKDVNFPLH